MNDKINAAVDFDLKSKIDDMKYVYPEELEDSAKDWWRPII